MGGQLGGWLESVGLVELMVSWQIEGEGWGKMGGSRGWKGGCRSPVLGLQGKSQPQPLLPIHFRICTKKINIVKVRHKLGYYTKGTDKSYIKQELSRSRK